MLEIWDILWLTSSSCDKDSGERSRIHGPSCFSLFFYFFHFLLDEGLNGRRMKSFGGKRILKGIYNFRTARTQHCNTKA